MLIANPKDRVTATAALQSPWLVNSEYSSDWNTKLEGEFAVMGIPLDLGTDKMLMRQIRTMDIVRLLPISARGNLPALLEDAFSNDLHLASLALLQSTTRQSADPTGSGDILGKAVREGRIDRVKSFLMLQNTALNLPCSDGETPLYIAADSGQIEMVEFLLRTGANPNAHPGLVGQRTVLQVAAFKQRTAIMCLLLENKADVNATGGNPGQTALQEAITHGNMDVIKLLLDHKADVNARTHKLCNTPLQEAATRRDMGLIKLLLQHGALVDGRCASGGPIPMQLAARHGYVEIVQLLLYHGADIPALPGSAGLLAL